MMFRPNLRENAFTSTAKGISDGHQPEAVSDWSRRASCHGHHHGAGGFCALVLKVAVVLKVAAVRGTTDLALAWWGNPTRNKNTEAMIAAYTAANPNVKISAQPGSSSSYWDKLATQTAGVGFDIIQMDMNYISEYGSRALCWICPVLTTSKFVEGTVDSGKINDKLVGVNAGINSAIIAPTRSSSRRPRWTCPTTKPGPGTR